MTWTEQRVAELTRLCTSSLFSCAEIAGRMTEEFRHVFSRNAVIGKLGRMGLTNKRSTGPKPRKPRPVRHDRFRPAKALRVGNRGWQAKPRLTPQIEPMTPLVADDDIPLEQRKTLMELENHHCRWPLGEPAEFFCGYPDADLAGRRPYCPQHTMRAWGGPGRAPERYSWEGRKR